MPPKESDMITNYIREVDDLFAVEVADKDALINDNTLQVIGSEVDEVYLENAKEVTIDRELVAEEGKTMKLVLSGCRTAAPKRSASGSTATKRSAFWLLPNLIAKSKASVNSGSMF